MIQRNIISFIILFGCCITLSCSEKDATPPPAFNPPPRVFGKTYSADEITAFKQLTLNETHTIIKLPKQVSVYIVDTGYAFMTKEIDSIIYEINLLLDTNLVLTRTHNRTGSVIQIYLTDRSTYTAAEPAAFSSLQNTDHKGINFPRFNLEGLIEYETVFVDMNMTDADTLEQRHIIYHEMMHALGFFGHVTLHDTSSALSLYPIDPFTDYYTPFDKRMMLLLYNPSIRPGMNEVEFNEVIKNL